MPTYEYRCDECRYLFEATYSISENPVVFCPNCKSQGRRLITGGSGFIMKGTKSDSTNNNHGTKCGKEQTCCGKSTPCETRPCDK